MHACGICGALVSPWECSTCLSCTVQKPRWLSNADAAVFVLEKERHPVTTYDVVRGIRREFGWTIPMGSMTGAMSSDRRFCWAGRSTYGLYRHGVFPGPRNLSGVAKLFLYSHRGPMRTEILAFAMQYAGYRFQQASLDSALRYDPNVRRTDWRDWVVGRSEEARAHLWQLGVSPTVKGVDEMAKKCCAILDQAIWEYRRRLAGPQASEYCAI